MNAGFNADQYGPVLSAWIAGCSEQPLDAGRPSGGGAALEIAEAFAHTKLHDREAGACCLAAAWLLRDELDRAHRLCQDVPTASGSYLHGVVHRREGDYGNAKYWFSRAGDHPVGPEIAAVAAQQKATPVLATGGVWNPAGFVDLCAVAVRSGDEALGADCRAVQAAEWRAVFDWCYREAVG